MPFDLRNRSVLVTGGSRGLGAAICTAFAAAGANIAVNYATREAPARELAERLQREHGVRTLVVRGDCGVGAECVACVRETVREFGGVDVVVGNAGWTKFSDFADLDALSEDEWDKCWKVNVYGQMALLREALPTFNKNPDGGVFIITSSIAGTSIGGSSMAYSVTKAAQLHLMRCLAQTQGPKVRINAVLPGLLLTEWGLLYSPERIALLKDKATLKKVTDIAECADAYIMIAKNTSMTGQRIAVDAGLNVASLY